MDFSESKRKYLVFGVIGFVVIGLIIASVFGNKQDQDFKGDFALYESMVQSLEDGNV